MMRFRLIVSLCALCLFPSAALEQEVFSVPIADKSSAGAPFEVSGKLTLQESQQADKVEWSWGEKVEIKNISDKAILLFIATITEVGRHHDGQRLAPGDGPTYRLGDDRFFNKKLIQPGESIVLRDTEPGRPDVACCVSPQAQVHDPSAEFCLRFVQFADGSAFGDPTEARDNLAFRQTILRGLQELIRSYEETGESGFTAQLKHLRSYALDPSLAPKIDAQPPFFQAPICRQILAAYDAGGARAALAAARKFLKIAEEHAAMTAMTAPHPPS